MRGHSGRDEIVERRLRRRTTDRPYRHRDRRYTIEDAREGLHVVRHLGRFIGHAADADEAAELIREHRRELLRSQ